MRLIDADALREDIETINYADWNNYSDTIDLIGDAPTIDAEPVLHGKWIESYCNLVCSCCKWEYSDELPFMSNQGIDKMSESFAYCPHCGAKMDGGGEDAQSSTN